MNKLKIEKKAAVLSALVEGNSIRSTERMTGIHRDTIMRLTQRIGEGCKVIMDETMRNLPCENIEVDEIWSFVGKKQRHLTEDDSPSRLGDIWVYVSLDRDTKLVPTFRIGKRTPRNTRAFIADLSSRMANRVQLSSDAMTQYAEAIERSFGSDIDYGQIVKVYEGEQIGPGRYSPPHVVAADRKLINGNPDFNKISTSHIERQNLTMRMCMRRFTRLTNAFSKTLENHKAAIALHFAHYNFCRRHQTLRVTPAQEAKIVNEQWSIQQLIDVAERAI